MSLYVEGDVPYIANGNCNNGYNNNGWNDWSWIIALALIGGLGNGGFGFGGNNFGGDFAGWQLGRLATTNDVASGFSTSEIMSDLNDIILGQAGIQQTLCQGFSGVNATVNTVGNNLSNAICTLGYQNQAGFNTLGSQLASCCCDIKTELMQNRYLNEKQTCDIVNASNANTRAILDYLTGEKISALQAENSGLKAQISNDKQSAYLISQLKEPCPIPSYLVPNPNCCYNYGVYATNGCNGTASVL